MKQLECNKLHFSKRRSTTLVNKIRLNSIYRNSSMNFQRNWPSFVLKRVHWQHQRYDLKKWMCRIILARKRTSRITTIIFTKQCMIFTKRNTFLAISHSITHLFANIFHKNNHSQCADSINNNLLPLCTWFFASTKLCTNRPWHVGSDYSIPEPTWTCLVAHLISVHKPALLNGSPNPTVQCTLQQFKPTALGMGHLVQN